MTTRLTFAFLPSLALLALAGCAAPLGGGDAGQRDTAAQRAACRQRADEAFNRQNPNDKFRSDYYVSGQRDTPFGGSMPSDPTADIQARYARAQLLDNCMKRANAQPAADAAAPVAIKPKAP